MRGYGRSIRHGILEHYYRHNQCSLIRTFEIKSSLHDHLPDDATSVSDTVRRQKYNHWMSVERRLAEIAETRPQYSSTNKTLWQGPHMMHERRYAQTRDVYSASSKDLN